MRPYGRRVVRTVRRYLRYRPATSDQFALLDLHLLLSAIALRTDTPDDPPPLLARLLFRLYQLLLPCQSTIWLYRTWVVYRFEQNATLSLSLACACLPIVSVVIRYGMLLATYGQFETTRRYLNARRYLADHPVAIGERYRAFRSINRAVLAVGLNCLVNVALYVVLRLYRHDIFRIPGTIGERYGQPLHTLLTALMVPFTANALATFMASFLLLYSLLISLLAELRIVGHSFRGLLQQTVAGGDCWGDLNRRLARCVQAHCDVLRCVTLVRLRRSVTKTNLNVSNKLHNRSATSSFAVQYYTALLSLAVDAFFISYNGADFVALLVVSFSLLLVVEWYFYCKLAEELHLTHKRIGWTLYADDWPDQLYRGVPGRHRKPRQLHLSLAIVLAATQADLPFQRNNLISVSWYTFGNLFKTSYSVLMFLVELRKHGR
ncbi:uncharacterized protein LOC118468777 [Anopheles albimanus]|uniref:uncharacterized protein LOC118468777 n=1 Tax=Anopheles albimanus TaxID=7167 RepID=UPI00163F7540|nr:uncharacterized protein LOC118468777 [Anopheles albimanus]